MNRPFAYVCSPFSGAPRNNTRKARSYCRKLYEMGYTPIAPHLMFPQFVNDAIPKERKDGLDMATELLKRCRVVVICGDNITAGMMDEIATAKRIGIVATTLEGIKTISKMVNEDNKTKEKEEQPAK